MARRKRRLSGAEIAAKWSKAMSNPTTVANYKDGVANAAVKPQIAAADAQAMNDYVAGVQNSVSSGHRAAALSKSAQTNDWEEGCNTKGAAALASSGTRKLAKAQQAFNEWAAHYAEASDAAAAIQGPKGDMSTAMAKVQAALSVLQRYGKRGSM